MQESLDPNNEEWEDLNKEQMGKPKILPRQTESRNPTSPTLNQVMDLNPFMFQKVVFPTMDHECFSLPLCRIRKIKAAGANGTSVSVNELL